MMTSILVRVSIVLMALHQCQSSSTTVYTTEVTTNATTEATTVTDSTADSTTTPTTAAASSSTAADSSTATTASTGSSTASTGSTTASTGSSTASTGSSTASTGSTAASTGSSTASTGSSTASTGSSTASAAATGSTDPASSTSATTIECYNGTCNGTGCLTNVSKENNFGTCTPDGSGTCKLVEDKRGDEPMYTMSCFDTTCDYMIRDGKITENCCSKNLCNNDIELLSASTTLLVSAWSVTLPCLYMLVV